MTSDDLEKWQARKISDALFRLTNYLVRLRQRMEKRGFPPGDELYRLTCTAHDAVCRLSMMAHCLACDGVVAPATFGAELPHVGEDDMCGRFVCSKAPEVYGSFYDVVAPAIAPNFNVAPTTPAPVIYGNPIAFAGVWETWKGEGDPVDSCAIITTDANELSRPIHDRMPVILRGADAEAWIDPHVEEPKSLAETLRPFPR